MGLAARQTPPRAKRVTLTDNGVGLLNSGALTVAGCTVSENLAGIANSGTLMLTNSTVSGNAAAVAGGGLAIINNVSGTLTLMNSTVSGNAADEGAVISNGGTLSSAGTLVDGDCATHAAATTTSNGYNIESPGDTCGFDQPSDQVDVAGPVLGPLQDNGGPTETHAAGSEAIDVIPADDCEVDTDQRGEPRPETGGTMCDVGAFERQPDDQ